MRIYTLIFGLNPLQIRYKFFFCLLQITPEPRRAPAGIFNDTEKCRRKIPRLPILLTPNANEQSNERKNNCTPGHPKRKRYPLSLKLHLIINYLLHVIIA